MQRYLLSHKFSETHHLPKAFSMIVPIFQHLNPSPSLCSSLLLPQTHPSLKFSLRSFSCRIRSGSSLRKRKRSRMGRTPCCDKKGLKKGPWTTEEDELLVNFINKNGGHGSWRSLPKLAGLLRCGKSCRLRWTNYLRPDIKRGPFCAEEEKLVIQLHGILGNRWAAIASQLAGRTDNEIKNLWNTHLKKRLRCMGLDPLTHKPLSCSSSPCDPHVSTPARHMAQWESARLEAEARLSKDASLSHYSSSDLFLRLWNSHVGDSFRNMHTVSSPGSSSSTKCPTVSNKFMAASDDSSISTDPEDSSDTALQLLLDFPIYNDMNFLEPNSFISPL